VREFTEAAFAQVDCRVDWQGGGRGEIGVDAKTGKTVVAIDPRYYRPTEIDRLVGDAAKAKQRLGWHPKHSFTEIVREMVTSDIALLEAEPPRFGTVD
jgi:GDPmannose 4,6-dehydratase